MRRPWHKQADKHEAEHGVWCDYVGWCEWMDERMTDEGDFFGVWDNMNELEKVDLYSAFKDACGHYENTPVYGT